MTPDHIPDLVEEIFTAFDGVPKLAEALDGTPEKTVYAWKQNGIPGWRRRPIVRAAAKLGIVLPTPVLDYLDPDRSALPSGGYPNSPGHQKTDTSKAAADQIEPSAQLKRRQVLAAVTNAGSRGITPDECAEAIGLSILSVRPRFTELKLRKQIIDSGKRRKNAGGRNAIVWILAPASE